MEVGCAQTVFEETRSRLRLNVPGAEKGSRQQTNWENIANSVRDGSILEVAFAQGAERISHI